MSRLPIENVVQAPEHVQASVESCRTTMVLTDLIPLSANDSPPADVPAEVVAADAGARTVVVTVVVVVAPQPASARTAIDAASLRSTIVRPWHRGTVASAASAVRCFCRTRCASAPSCAFWWRMEPAERQSPAACVCGIGPGEPKGAQAEIARCR